MGSVVDELNTKMLHKMKHDLEDWREALLLVNSLLKWDKTFYAGIIGGAVSVGFLLIWWMDLSVLTMVSLAALAVVVLDYAYPILSKFVFSPDQWTGVQEKRFEELCQELCSVRRCVCGLCQCLLVGKDQKTTKYYITTVTALMALAYIGSNIDNLLLSYLTVLAVALYPGLQTHGFVQKAQAKEEKASPCQDGRKLPRALTN